MTAYWNSTNEFITYKTWLIDSAKVSQTQLASLDSVGVKGRLTYDMESFNSRGQTYHYGAGSRAEFKTTCEKQELMLQLMYGKDLLLMRVDVVPPNSTVYT